GAEGKLRRRMAEGRRLRTRPLPDTALGEAQPEPDPLMDLVGFVQTVASGILTGGVYAMVGIGLSLIFGVMRIVNFAHGEFMAVGMYIAFALFRSLHLDPYLSLIVVAPAGFLLGAFVERVLLAPIQNAAEHSLILMTVGVGLILSNSLLLIFGAHPETIYTSYSTRTVAIGPVTLSVPLLGSFP